MSSCMMSASASTTRRGSSSNSSLKIGTAAGRGCSTQRLNERQSECGKGGKELCRLVKCVLGAGDQGW